MPHARFSLSSWHLRLRSTRWLFSLGSWEVARGHRASHMGALLPLPIGLISFQGRSDTSPLPLSVPQNFPSDQAGFYLRLMLYFGNDFHEGKPKLSGPWKILLLLGFWNLFAYAQIFEALKKRHTEQDVFLFFLLLTCQSSVSSLDKDIPSACSVPGTISVLTRCMAGHMTQESGRRLGVAPSEITLNKNKSVTKQ